MNKTLKIFLKIGGGIFLLLFIALIAYLIYFLSSYYRIEDYTSLTTENVQAMPVQKNIPYTITTYNIGFGAYSDDFSFFMDGGENAIAFSKEDVIQNINGSTSVMKDTLPDFAFFQEVDVNSTRSYHVNQYTMIQEAFPEMSSVFAANFDSPYIFYPFTQPHGKSLAGLVTLSKFESASAMRRSLPIDDNWNKYLDLDRCYSYVEYPINKEQSLFLYNVHLSAYSLDPSTVENQVKQLSSDISKKQDDGHYVIVGGDFNQDILGNSDELYGFDSSKLTWARALDTTLLPPSFAIVPPSDKESIPPTCRLADKPYVKGESLVLAIDGFIVSDNIRPVSLAHLDVGFLYSDHDPVTMTFILE